MRFPLVLHAASIFFSFVFAWFSMFVFSVVFFVFGLFFMFFVVGDVYGLDVKFGFVFSVVATIFVSFVVFCFWFVLPHVSLVFGVLDIFFVLQAAFWSSVLLPLAVRRYCVSGGYLDFLFVVFFSTFVAVFSLFSALLLVYGSLYTAFCFALLWFLGRCRVEVWDHNDSGG